MNMQLFIRRFLKIIMRRLKEYDHCDSEEKRASIENNHNIK